MTLIDCGLIALEQMRRLAKAKNTEPKGEAPPREWSEEPNIQKGHLKYREQKRARKIQVWEKEAEAKSNIS